MYEVGWIVGMGIVVYEYVCFCIEVLDGEVDCSVLDVLWVVE